jgi:hypothetical protein
MRVYCMFKGAAFVLCVWLWFFKITPWTEFLSDWTRLSILFSGVYGLYCFWDHSYRWTLFYVWERALEDRKNRLKVKSHA